MSFLFRRELIRCFACEKVGRSRINRIYQGCFLGMALLTWMTWKAGIGLPRPYGFGHGPFAWRLGHSGPGWIVLAVPAVTLLFRKRAHRCGSCGSEFWKPAG